MSDNRPPVKYELALLPPAHTSVFANLVPVVAFAIGVVWLGESGTIFELVGAGSILVGLYLMRRSRAGRNTEVTRPVSR
ncbi:MAG: EamA family transporter [Rhodothermales bacterium]|jgi:drug/metabolite transporter (DMT)-like permease